MPYAVCLFDDRCQGCIVNKFEKVVAVAGAREGASEQIVGGVPCNLWLTNGIKGWWSHGDSPEDRLIDRHDWKHYLPQLRYQALISNNIMYFLLYYFAIRNYNCGVYMNRHWNSFFNFRVSMEKDTNFSFQYYKSY